MYKIIEKNCEIEGTDYTTYGVECGTSRIDDITTELNKISDFVDVCNRNDVSIIHFIDIVEDFIV